ncbi:hypothetical protein [Ectobacillus ponti]|uniref:Uncharacterized protein n=1 Tax=Ectobacillus ponti TaxID=2961894 RepID=A0AA41X3T5_9BACI|nr:hypothetical protein [Ectobacillus ponti]MCP8968421.1 hypothetical protein [Ectobacillus ponti]
MTKLQRFIIAIPAVLLLAGIGMVWVFANWQSLFGQYRPMEALKAVYTLEVKGESVAMMHNIDNDTLYVTKGSITPLVDQMKEQGYELTAQDRTAGRLVFQRDSHTVSVPTQPFWRGYRVFINPPL